MPWRNRLRSYTILTDESEVGSVRDGETASADVEAGYHRLRLKIDRTGSRTTELEVGTVTSKSLSASRDIRLSRRLHLHRLSQGLVLKLLDVVRTPR